MKDAPKFEPEQATIAFFSKDVVELAVLLPGMIIMGPSGSIRVLEALPFPRKENEKRYKHVLDTQPGMYVNGSAYGNEISLITALDSGGRGGCVQIKKAEVLRTGEGFVPLANQSEILASLGIEKLDRDVRRQGFRLQFRNDPDVLYFDLNFESKDVQSLNSNLTAEEFFDSLDI